MIATVRHTRSGLIATASRMRATMRGWPVPSLRCRET